MPKNDGAWGFVGGFQVNISQRGKRRNTKWPQCSYTIGNTIVTRLISSEVNQLSARSSVLTQQQVWFDQTEMVIYFVRNVTVCAITRHFDQHTGGQTKTNQHTRGTSIYVI